ncbi:hypothetical protein EJV47_06245 [Hymenobacter gummosus]|uniref:RDD domain-containing protein n=2 Tax=Hymenobacter gummosus TaxID=1776032 RepID=A0A3S0H6K3_9BACT|nr:hypothetical protein EJV47_06245 [Hymenobacter gummosus]
MLLDHWIMCLLLVGPAASFMLAHWQATTFEAEQPDIVAILLGLGFMLLYMLKDSFRGQSLAKRVLRLRVVDRREGRPASVLRCFVRNLTIWIWPVEVLFAFFNPSRRLGDFIAGTRVEHLGGTSTAN